jgi:hypothetical protein
VEQRHSINELLIHAVARILGRQNPFHASFGRGVDELRLLAHGHEAESEDCCFHVLKSAFQEGGVVVGAFLDGNRGMTGECGGRVGAGDDCDVEVVRGEEGCEDFGADCAACLGSC